MLQSMGRKEWNSTERLNINNKAAGFLGGSAVKSPPAGTGVVGLIPGPEDALEKTMATHSSILAWEIPWTEEPGGLRSVGSHD